MNWINGVNEILKTISQILTAGIAITAFALLLYSLTFNLKDRVAQAFATIMFCLVIIFSTESFGATSTSPQMVNFWLKLQWVGIILIPPAFLHFSDSLLATTGLPSRWRRKWAVRLVLIFSVFLIFLVWTPWFLGDLVLDKPPAPHHQPTVLTELFTLYYIFILILAWINFYRAYKRTVTRTSKRRMLYLTVSALGPAIGSFPFLLYGSEFAGNQTFIFWILVILVNFGLATLIFIMAYAVAFFGVPWPDRVVKSRLVKWTLRGPVTASLALAFTTLVKRGGEAVGIPYSAFIPIVMVVTILLVEYAITLFYPFVEKWLFFGKDEKDLILMRSLEERIITRVDLKQFIEMILAAVSDRTQAPGAFLIAVDAEGLHLVDQTEGAGIKDEEIDALELFVETITEEEKFKIFENDILIPLRTQFNGGNGHVLGYLGILGMKNRYPLEPDAMESLERLTQRASIALRDRELLEDVFDTLERLNPQEALVQQFRVAGRFNQQQLLIDEERYEKQELTMWVKEALTHYWGGPKLTDSPMMKLEIVKKALNDHDDNPVNALRSVLRNAIDQLRPEGERKYTGEWILYNILDMKFMDGKKVREIALKLAVSEADLYRKQRVAIEAVADVIAQEEMKLTISS